ncbi:MAG: TMEM43 family protein [Deltaproteobacteria bacterium]|nr:TMEM43 family protein [Deltaproteobacteria bacterium]
MAAVEVQYEGWFSRILGSIKSVLFGGLLVLVAVPLLWWNEGRAVQTAKSLEQGAGEVVSVAADRVDPANERTLVHVSGQAVAASTPEDPIFGVRAEALRLRRAVEMFQWREHERTEERKKLGGGKERRTTYNYKAEWTESHVDSSRFKEPGHSNPPGLPYPSETFDAEAKLGAFTLIPEQLAELDDFTPLPPPEAALGKQPPPGYAPPRAMGSALYLAVQGGVAPTAGSPAIGDVRVRFESVPEGPVSVVAVQNGESFAPWQAPAGDAVLLVAAGSKTADQMFAKAQADNRALTWVLRLLGFVFMWVGWGLVFRPVAVVADVIPFVGSILGFGVAALGFVLAGLGSSVIIAMAWIFYRPLLGITLLLLVGGVVGAVWYAGRQRQLARA